MDRAIHKPTGKIISADKLLTDLSWKGKEREEWIAPECEISNLIELKQKGIIEVLVSFVKAHNREINNEKQFVRSHFRIITEGAIDKSESESEEHKLAKEGIYYALWDNTLKLSIANRIINPSELGTFDLEIEEKLGTFRNSKIGDVVLTLDKIDPIIGKGIVFEIQISSQGYEKTEERTYDRIKQGYSVVWLWSDMFSPLGLKKDTLNVVLFRDAIEQYNQFQKGQIREYANLIDKKMQELQTMNIALTNFKQEVFSFLNKEYQNAKTHILDNLDKEKNDIYEKIKQLDFIINEQRVKLNSQFSDNANKLDLEFKAVIDKKIQEISNLPLDNYVLEQISTHLNNCHQDMKSQISKIFPKITCTTCKVDFHLTDIQWLHTNPYCQKCWLVEYKNTIPSIESSKKIKVDFYKRDEDGKDKN